ncbi:hypothetical protein, partial [Aeromonas caviae]|uniref:hypothetical protein n=1 Tax=Aeromonas caviae TaxID=648 RepID=UPI001F2CA455
NDAADGLLVIGLFHGLQQLVLEHPGGVIFDAWLITSCRSANNIMPITIFLPAGTASFFYSA